MLNDKKVSVDKAITSIGGKPQYYQFTAIYKPTKTFMRCKICKKSSRCAYCSSCDEDLSSDSDRSQSVQKRKFIAKNYLKKSKKVKVRKNVDHNSQRFEIQLRKKLCLEPHQILSDADRQYYNNLLKNERLSLSQQNLLAQTQSACSSRLKQWRLQSEKRMIQMNIQCQDMAQLLFLLQIEHQIIVLFNTNELFQLMQQDHLPSKNDTTSIKRTHCLVGFGSDIRKIAFTKSNNSIMILKKEVIKRCLYLPRNRKQSRNFSFPENFVESLTANELLSIFNSFKEEEISDQLSVQDGIYLQSQVIGSLSINKDVQKIILCQSQIPYNMLQHISAIIQKTKIPISLLSSRKIVPLSVMISQMS